MGQSSSGLVASRYSHFAASGVALVGAWHSPKRADKTPREGRSAGRREAVAGGINGGEGGGEVIAVARLAHVAELVVGEQLGPGGQLRAVVGAGVGVEVERSAAGPLGRAAGDTGGL